MPFACTKIQRNAVRSPRSADGDRALALLEACSFMKACVHRNATGRLQALLARMKQARGGGSQQLEDIQIYFNFFDGQAGSGVYVELGALDGVYLSNSALFDRLLGWRGVLIEANLAHYLMLERNIRLGKRRNVSAIHAAACASPLMLRVPSPNLADRGVVTSHRTRQIMFAAHKFGSAVATSRGEAGGSTTGTLCVPMRTLLEAAPQTATARGIDFYSIDVEGAELSVVDSHDWARLPARVLLVEVGGRAQQHEQTRKIHRVLRDRAGMCRFAMGGHGNELWVDPHFDQKVGARPLAR